MSAAVGPPRHRRPGVRSPGVAGLVPLPTHTVAEFHGKPWSRHLTRGRHGGAP